MFKNNVPAKNWWHLLGLNFYIPYSLDLRRKKWFKKIFGIGRAGIRRGPLHLVKVKNSSQKILSADKEKNCSQKILFVTCATLKISKR